MAILRELRSLTSVQRNTFAACFLGWSLDALDFFLLTVCLSAIATEFRVGTAAVAEALFWTLVMRPVGALLFGLMAERVGRRPTLMLNVIAFSGFELASAFAPTLHSFLICRALFGIAMGGVWGVGAALALETLPPGQPRLLLRPPPGRLRSRKSARRRPLRCTLPSPPRHRHVHRMARHVHDRRPPRAPRLLPPVQGRGIPRVASRQNPGSRAHPPAQSTFEGKAALHLPALIPLRDHPDDGLHLIQPRNPGPLPHLPPERPRPRPRHSRPRSSHRQHRRTPRRHLLRNPLRTPRPQARPSSSPHSWPYP